MKLEFKPHSGLGDASFGMSRSQIAAAFAGARSSTNAVGGGDRVYFEDLDCFVEFDKSGGACAFETGPDARVVWNGIELFSESFDALVRLVERHGHVVERDSEGFICRAIGLGVWAECAGEPEAEDEPADSIIVFREGYYDR